jgi:hypothetical protein
MVEAVFDAFFATYQRRIRDLIRIATGGSGVLPAGDLHPDLVNRIAKEASKSAQNVLTMCIRAFEYLPPVDVTFGDFLRALVTADYEAVPEDEAGIRAAMVEAFRLRGIYPEGATSLAEDALLWPRAKDLKLSLEAYNQTLGDTVVAYDRWGKTSEVRDEINRRWAVELTTWAKKNAAALELDAEMLRLAGFHTVFRFSPGGQLIVELVAQFQQEDPATKGDADYGGVAFKSGATIIAGADGAVRYVISKPPSNDRRERQKECVSDLDRTDFALTWTDDQTYEPARMKARTSFAALHRGVR